MDFQEKCRLVKLAKPGDTWVSVKTGRLATILSHGNFNSVRIRHESGRVTIKGDHYFAGDYDPVTKDSPSGTKIGSLVFKATREITPQELALGWLRYEAIRKLSPFDFEELRKDEAKGTALFDDQIDELVMMEQGNQASR
jgi:hypothetical protein